MTRRAPRWVIGAVVAATLAIATPAMAHTVYSGGSTNYLYYSSADCVAGYSEISHGSGYGYSKAKVWSRYVSSYNCGASFWRPAGYLAIDRILWWAPNESSLPSTCRDTGWLYNSSGGSDFTNIATYGYLICGAGRYATYAGLFMNNGGWKGGWLASGGHNTPF